MAKTVKNIKITKGALKDKQYKMVLTASGYVPRDPTYPLSGAGKHSVADTEKKPKDVKEKKL